MEMIEITGDKVAAVKCNVETYENCSEQEKSFVDKAKIKYLSVDAIKAEIARIHKVSLNVSPSAKAWANARTRILLSLQETVDKDEL
mmetsp:Transcript_9967/g.18717  ORF Transcript_9967/g.18717 Transcript_9967/m.18717 type:complete len:87 (+) Transcript_9967:1-261(+)